MSNCFFYKQKISAFIDNELKPNEIADVEKHLSECPACAEHKHRMLMVTREIKLIDIKQSNFEMDDETFSLKKHLNYDHKLRKFHFSFPVKLALEGFLAFAIIVGTLLVVPNVKKYYDSKLSNKFEMYNIKNAPLVVDYANQTTPITDNAGAQNDETSAGKGQAPGENTENIDEDFGESSIKEGIENKETGEVGKSKVNRLIIKTDNPNEMKQKIFAILKKHRAAKTTEIELGQEVPGGIYFDFTISEKEQKAILAEFKSISDYNVYINNSRRKIPQGSSRIILFLQQI